VFHPLKYLLSLKEICLKNGIQIYESTKIYKIQKEKEGYICKTNNHKIKAKKVVLACHYPFFVFPFFMPIKTYIEKSYITASKVEKNEKKTYITSKNPTKSIRYYEDKIPYLIYLRNSHKIGNDLNEEKNFSDTLLDAEKKNLKPEYIWSNTDIMTYDQLPFIGKIGKNLFIATGYNTWGMTNGTIAGQIISDLILEKENPYENLFNPHRKSFKNKVKTYPKNIFMNTKSYLQNKLFKKKKWYPNTLTFKIKHGKSIAIYKENGKEHIVYTKCPHMGCTLVFNEFEKTWDCPCHASKFDIDGKCIQGPSLYDIGYKKADK
jgi:Rieske Fe-S protein